MRIVLFIIACLVSPSLALASDFMRIGEPTEGPWGFARLCEQKPQVCQSDNRGNSRVTLTPERLVDLDEVNRFVNQRITPMVDYKKHGVVERWEMLYCLGRTTCYGDCEEYVLLKRHILLLRGWPASALLITVVNDPRGEGHAVLTARTSAGDFVLDNQTDEVLLWHRTKNKYRSQQSPTDPTVWHEIIPPRPVTTASSKRSRQTE